MSESKVTFAEVAQVVAHEMLEEDEWADLLSLLYRLWVAQGANFYSPGGSPQRRLAATVHELLNHRRMHGAGSTMRAGRDPEINKLVERFYDEASRRLEHREANG